MSLDLEYQVLIVLDLESKASNSLSKIIPIQDVDFEEDIDHQPYFNVKNYINTKHRLLGRQQRMRYIHESLQDDKIVEPELEVRPLEHTKNFTMTTSSLNERDKEILLQNEILKRIESQFYSPETHSKVYDFRNFNIEPMNLIKVDESDENCRYFISIISLL